MEFLTEILAFLPCYAQYVGSYSPIFQYSISIPSSWVKHGKKF